MLAGIFLKMLEKIKAEKFSRTAPISVMRSLALERPVVSRSKMMYSPSTGASQGLSYNKFDRDVTMSPVAISTVQKKTVTDEEPEKRVELHCHTTMSMMDGMTPAAELVKRAAKQSTLPPRR